MSATVAADVRALLHARLLEPNGLDPQRLDRALREAMRVGGDFADLYLKSHASERWSLEDGRIRSGGFTLDQGFGLRVLAGERVVFSSSQRLADQALSAVSDWFADAVPARQGQGPAKPPPAAPSAPAAALYGSDDPLASADSAFKVGLLRRLDDVARRHDPRVRAVFATLSVSWDHVWIQRHDGFDAADVRPMVGLQMMVHVEANGRRETASSGFGARTGLSGLDAEMVASAARGMVDAALQKLDARPCPAGTSSVVIGPGWNGVLLHEAVGHGLEADFNRRGSSAFSGRIGERVAAPGVTVLDDATVPHGHGSLAVDDEGTPGQRTVLIEDGILRGYMTDMLDSRLSGRPLTGNGRRQSFDSLPMPRMTNTFMDAGAFDPDEIVRSVSRGIYVRNLSGGQVDISSGRFVFDASEAFLIENGRITAPVVGATILGTGADALRRVRMIGNDSRLDEGRGLCAKAGQVVPVGVGQPTLRIDDMVVGGAG